MTPEIAAQVFRKIKELGCYSVHIGGGEPFLDTVALENVIKVARDESIHIEYIETNSSWYRDEESVTEILFAIKKAGVSTLLISISPFHNEHIPFKKVKGVIRACKRAGISTFLWIPEFYPEIDQFDDQLKHTLDEYRQKFGDDYVKRIPSRYWIHFGGRALKTFREKFPLQPLRAILENSGRCRELTDTTHFHVDLFGNYIPGLCSGLAIQIQDLGKPLDPDKYPFINMLFSEGIKGFLKLAQERYGFIPGDQYFSKCDLCLEIRQFLANEKRIPSHELEPREFYQHIED